MGKKWTHEQRAKFRRTMMMKRSTPVVSKDPLDLPVVSEIPLEPGPLEREDESMQEFLEFMEASWLLYRRTR
jgi:hypothetical protein